jgi:DNA-directed RNA polymerase subunit RPC12/RpoP
MQKCPQCGKRLPDYARKCKYCDADLPAPQPKAAPAGLKVFECPGCGAPLDYRGAGTTLECPYCRNSVIVPPELRPPEQPEEDDSPQDESMIAQVIYCVQAEQHDQAVELLCNRGSLGREEAEELVNRLSTGQDGDPAALIIEAFNNSR